MTLVRIFAGKPSEAGSPVPLGGQLRFTPTRDEVIEGEPDMLVMPVAFDVVVPKETGRADVHLTPGMVWEVYSSGFGVTSRYEYVTIPDVAEVDFTKLQRVDKTTLSPVATPEALWWIELSKVQAGGGGGGVTSYNDLTDKPAIPTKPGDIGAAATKHTHALADLPPGLVVAVVSDGAAWPARPTSRTDIMVHWVGGDIQPAGMLEGDIWFQSGPTPDTTGPSAPAGLTASGITSSGFTVSWAASTDDTAVTGYEVSVNDTVAATPSGTSATVAGLSPEASYAVTVRATDAAGNWSEPSTPLAVTTAAVATGGTDITGAFSIVGANENGNYPAFLGGTILPIQSDGPLTLATAFYATEPGWEIVGGRLWVPAEASAAVGSSAEFGVLVGDSLPLDSAPTAIASIAALSMGPNEAALSSATEMPVGVAVWLSVRLTTPTWWRWDPAYQQAVKSSDAPVYQAGADNTWGGRSRYLYPAGTSGEASHVYGIDILFRRKP